MFVFIPKYELLLLDIGGVASSEEQIPIILSPIGDLRLPWKQLHGVN